METNKWEAFFNEYEQRELKIQKKKVWKFILIQFIATIFTGIFLAWLILTVV